MAPFHQRMDIDVDKLNGIPQLLEIFDDFVSLLHPVAIAIVHFFCVVGNVLKERPLLQRVIRQTYVYVLFSIFHRLWQKVWPLRLRTRAARASNT